MVNPMSRLINTFRKALCLHSGSAPLKALPLVGLFVILLLFHSRAPAQAPRRAPNGAGSEIQLRDMSGHPRAQALIADVFEPEVLLEVDPRHSKLVRTRAPVARFSITNPEILEVVQFSPTEFELIGGQAGETTLTLWFDNETILRYLVRVARDVREEERVDVEYGQLQAKINELFPNSAVQLIPFADKLIVRGQARDSAEATQILSLITGEAVDQTGQQLGPGSYVTLGTAAQPYPGESDLPATNVINLLDVPGEQQIMLRVRVAELSRSAVREMGANFEALANDFTFTSSLGVTGAFNAVLDTQDVDLALQAVSSNSYSKILAEPNLVTLNGQPASFIAGGEFAVPTVVGVDGVSAATTRFRGFGTQLVFTPTIIDKDRIRLSVAPSFTEINNDLEVNGIPGLNSRAVVTTVDLREGQWLAIAGLLEDRQGGGKVRVPYIGDIPILDAVFSRRNVNRDETELVVLVSPEIVHPMEAEEVPLVLPGMEVTEPGDWDFFVFGYYEGRECCQHRSTVWPIYQDRMHERKCSAMREALHQTKTHAEFQDSESYYVYGDHGLSR
jgi:pilus assembly protein CpaC